jgi:Spherulation-specific family 4/Fibronectin type III domain
MSKLRNSQVAKLAFAAIMIAFCFAQYPAAAQTTIGQQISDPSYFTPGPDSLWTELSISNPSAPAYAPLAFATANVDNGPNYIATSDYAQAIQSASSDGVKVLGYVNTGYFGTTSTPQATRLGYTDPVSWTSQIEHDINAWFSFYGSSGLSGIFLDQAQNTCGTNNSYATLYTNINNFVKQNYPGAVVVANPGTAVPQCFQNSVDTLVTFEDNYDCYTKDSTCVQEVSQGHTPYQALSWSPIDPHKQIHLVYNTTQSQLANASTLSKERLAGYFYVTPANLPNPYDSLPPYTGSGNYWSAELADAAPGGTADTTPPTTPTHLAAESTGPISVELKWTASTDSGSGVVGYDVYQNGVWIVAVPAASSPKVTIGNLIASTSYSFYVIARDGAGNQSANSNTLSVTTSAAAGTITAPGSPQVTQVAYTDATLSWTASTSNNTVTYYDIFLNAGSIPFVTVAGNVTSVVLTGLDLAGTPPFAFTIKARDTDGDVSAASSVVNITPTPLPGGAAITNPTATYTSTALTYSANYLLPFGLRHVYIDSDDSKATGFLISWTTPEVGADYLIENNTLYQYTSTQNQTDWTWTSVGTVTPTVTGYNVTWTVPVGNFTNLATTQVVFYEGVGNEPTSYPNPATPLTITEQ